MKSIGISISPHPRLQALTQAQILLQPDQKVQSETISLVAFTTIEINVCMWATSTLEWIDNSYPSHQSPISDLLKDYLRYKENATKLWTLTPQTSLKLSPIEKRSKRKRIIMGSSISLQKCFTFILKTIQSSSVKLLPVNIIGLSNFVFIGEAVCSTSFKFVAWEKKQFSFISFWFVQAKKLFSFAFSPLKSPFSPKVWKLFILLKKLKASKFCFVDFWRNNSGSSNSKKECFSL